MATTCVGYNTRHTSSTLGPEHSPLLCYKASQETNFIRSQALARMQPFTRMLRVPQVAQREKLILLQDPCQDIQAKFWTL